MDYKSLTLRPKSSMAHYILEKHYLRKHGPGAYYGQNPEKNKRSKTGSFLIPFFDVLYGMLYSAYGYHYILFCTELQYVKFTLTIEIVHNKIYFVKNIETIAFFILQSIILYVKFWPVRVNNHEYHISANKKKNRNRRLPTDWIFASIFTTISKLSR